jgi:hypothetical protein
MKTRPISLVAALSAFALAGGLILSSNADARPPGADGEAKMEQRFEKRMERIEKRVSEKLAPRLELTDAQTAKLVALMKTKAAEKKAAHEQLRLEVQSLEQLVASGAGDSELAAQSAAVAAARESMPTRHDILDETATFLSAEQQAKLILEVPKHKKQRRKMMRKMRARRGGGDFAGPPDLAD